jgi:anti-anti-sigma regulatory factor
MCRITATSGDEGVVLRLEGRLSGAWVDELDACWHAVLETQQGRPIWIDLREVDGIDAAGRALLTRMCHAGVGFVASGCVMPELVRQMKANVAGLSES